MNYKVAILSLIIISGNVFSADDIVNTRTQNTISQNTAVRMSHIGIAKDWALTDTEWAHYLILMQGPSGHYYTKLSPPEVLGIQATNAEELRHFAEISAKLEHDKLERELRFNLAFHEAATRLYSTEPMIQPFDYTPFTPISKNER